MCVLVSVSMYIHTHTHIFHPEVKWSLDNYSNKHPLLRAGACAFRETSKKYQNLFSLNLEFKL